MIILVYPMLSASDLYADSNWVFLVALLKTIVRKKKDWFFYVVVPSGARVIDGELFDDNIIPITMDFPDRSRHRFCSHFDAKAMLRIYHDIPIDLVFNQVPEVGHLLSGSFREKMGRYNTPIINQHHYVMHPSHPNYLLLDYIEMSQIAGSLIADVNVYNSSYTESMMLDIARKHLNPAGTERIRQSGHIIPMGTLPKKPRNVKKYDRFTFVYNHRIAKYKGTDVTFKVFDRLWKHRQDFDLAVALEDRGQTERGNRWKITPGVTRSRFFATTETEEKVLHSGPQSSRQRGTFSLFRMPISNTIPMNIRNF